ncbi:MAG: 23S rRNA (guanosine(2251)-2'-O)-methyltransferase RlmB [Endomicrobium sp.]|jgi:23S rRNA (guanosine2251-2'-O)-methyltransferase|nr:23S rRNA (guanosine(2251)-2'-O)-methyltransferase RlmB [Endomicrobium sp.]
MYKKRIITKDLSLENIICGRNSVLELLKAGKRTVNKLLVSHTAKGSIISEIIDIAKQKNVAVHFVPPEKLDCFSEYSQGVAAEVSSIQYVELEYLIKQSNKSAKPLLVILDGIEDPHNLGAIIRNCVAFGSNGIIIPKWRSAAVNETVSRASAGSVEHISISRVSNINQCINLLKANNFWIAGAENGGQNLADVDMPFPLAVIIGSEGAGIHDLTKRHCDFLLSIPQKSVISSLNASCACAVILYEISKKLNK